MSTTPTHETEQAALRESVLEHLWQRYPQHCLILTDPQTRHAIDVGVVRAARHGFRDVSLVRPYIGLMTLLGSHFDEDPQLPWAQESLRRSVGAVRRTAMHELLQEVTQTMTPIIGANGEYYQRALAWLGSRSIEMLSDYGETHEGLIVFLRHLHRRKQETLSRDTMDRLIRRASTAASARGSSSAASTVVHLGMMFMLGFGIDQDPFHPWVAKTTRESGTTDPAATTHDLHAAAMDFLRRTIALNALSAPENQP